MTPGHYIFAGLLVMFLLSLIRVWYYYRQKAKFERNERFKRAPVSLTSNKFIHPADIRVIKRIAKGSYGDVWKCKFNGKKVAVKMLSFQKVSEPKLRVIFRALTTVKHSKIIRIIRGASINTRGLHGYALIMEYHPKGSLLGYLQNSVLDHTGLLKICVSLLCAMDYLAMECTGKPPIAHRDINPSNILVNNNGECVLADFSSAVPVWRAYARLPYIGTSARYVAPELLDKTYITFQEAQMGDMYSAGLTLWEVCRRCSEFADPYMKAYENLTAPNPPLEHMFILTRILKLRPEIPERWKNDAILEYLSKLITECWHEIPTMRITASRAKQNAKNLQEGKVVELADVV